MDAPRTLPLLPSAARRRGGERQGAGAGRVRWTSRCGSVGCRGISRFWRGTRWSLPSLQVLPFHPSTRRPCCCVQGYSGYTNILGRALVGACVLSLMRVLKFRILVTQISMYLHRTRATCSACACCVCAPEIGILSSPALSYSVTKRRRYTYLCLTRSRRVGVWLAVALVVLQVRDFAAERALALSRGSTKGGGGRALRGAGGALCLSLLFQICAVALAAVGGLLLWSALASFGGGVLW